MSSAESFLESIVHILRFCLESAGVTVLIIGLLVCLYLLLRAAANRDIQGAYRIRTVFLRFLIIVLELQLASDILSTAIAPEWEQLGKVGAIALIRTFLNYALTHELKDSGAEKKE